MIKSGSSHPGDGSRAHRHRDRLAWERVRYGATLSTSHSFPTPYAGSLLLEFSAASGVWGRVFASLGNALAVVDQRGIHFIQFSFSLARSTWLHLWRRSHAMKKSLAVFAVIAACAGASKA